MGRMHAGMDEAGRGPVVGPLVVAVVAARDPKEIEALGVRDSKQLSAARREQLDREIRSRAAHVALTEVHAPELDTLMAHQSLNDIEVDVFAALGRGIAADVYYLDACDTNEARFGAKFLAKLGRDASPPRIVSEHRADETYPLVSAASIVAKVRRDAVIASIAQRLEPLVGVPLGSGYSHDESTRRFLDQHLARFGTLPQEARRAWETSKEIIRVRAQRRLSSF